MAKLRQILTILGILAFAGVSLAETPAQERLLKTGISKPELPWVDAPGVFSGPTSVDGGGSALLTHGRKGNGSGAGNGGTEFTKPASGSGSGSGAGGGQGGGGAGGGGPGEMSSQSSPGGSGVQKLPRYYPMCLFIDAIHDSGTGNAAVKGLVDDAAKCGVALVVFPFTIKSNYGEDPDGINEAQRKMCNIPDAGIAPAASTSACVMHEHSDNLMCGNGPPPEEEWDGTAGCAELRAARGAVTQLTDKQKEEAKARSDGVDLDSMKGPGGVAVSIEDNASCNAKTVGHEALGHSQFGHPNGASDGHGIGIDQEGGGGDGWTQSGCTAMFANAFENDGRWTYDPSRETYYTKPKNQEAWKDLNQPDPIFKTPKQTALQGQQPPQVSTPAGQRITMSDEPKSQNPSAVPPAQPKTGKAQMEDGQEGRHRKLGSGVSLLLGRKGGETVDGEPELEKPGKFVATPKAPPNYPPKNPGPRIGFDDAAPKGRSIKGGGATVTSAEAPPADIYGDSAGSPGEVSSAGADGASMSRGQIGTYESGSGSGGKIGYDDNAPKGGLSGSGFYDASPRSPASVGTTSRAGSVARPAGNWRSSDAEENDEFFDEVGEREPGDKRKNKDNRRRRAINVRDATPGKASSSRLKRSTLIP